MTGTRILAAAERAIALARNAPAGGSLLVWSRRGGPTASPLAAFDAAPRRRLLLWEGNDWLLGSGAAIEFAADGPARSYLCCRELADWRARTVADGEAGAPPPRFLCAQSFSYLRPGGDAWGPLPGARLFLPRRCEHASGWVQHAIAVGPEDKAADLAERCCAPGEDERSLDVEPGPPPAGPDFAAMVAAAVNLLRHGAMRKVVLARAVDEVLPSPIQIAEVLDRLHRDADPASTVYAYDLPGNGCFVGATPELLFDLDGRRLRTMALAGSRPRSEDPDVDGRLGEELRTSTKERKEHQLVVEHLAKVLHQRGEGLAVPASPELRRLPRLQHLETRLEVDLASPSCFDLLGHLHPTPAVCGLPRGTAAEYIQQQEGLDRGLYAGCLGHVADGRARFVVPLRGGIVDGDRARCFAGAGIVETSDPAAELAETEDKLAPMRRALGVLR